MRSTLVIARRELTEKRFVFLAAIAFALLSLVVPFMPGVRAGDQRSALVIASLVLSTGFTVGLAAMLGATIIGRELSERRLSFYFSRPVPGPSIWFGKLIAALVLIVVSFAVVAAPALIAGVRNVVLARAVVYDTFPISMIILAFATAFFLLAHVIGTFVRSRCGWIVFDFVAAAVCAAALWLLARPLMDGFAIELIKTLAMIFASFAVVAVVAAGAWQVAQGRTDRGRSHRELSRFLWIWLGCGLLVVAGYVTWVVSVTPADLRPDQFTARAGNGSWAIIVGTAKHRGDYRATFLYDLANGRSVRMTRMQPWGAALFSADSNTAFWLVPSSGVEELWMARLDAPNPRPMPARITLGNSNPFDLSRDGSRVAAIDAHGILAVHDVVTGASLGSVKIPDGNYWRAYFVRPDLVRIYGYFNGPLESKTPIFEYDVARRVVSQTGEFPFSVWRFSDDHTRALGFKDRSALEIYDARSGALVRSIPGHFTNASFLRDGRIAAVSEGLRIFSADGAPLRDIPLPGSGVEGIVDAGGARVVVVLRQKEWSSVVVDIDRGAAVRIEPGLRPMMFGNSGPRLLCYSRDGLVVWTPATGEKRVLSGRSRPAAARSRPAGPETRGSIASR